MKLLSWNMAHRHESWRYLLDSKVDVALLQEAGQPPKEIVNNIVVDSAPWKTAGAGVSRPWRTAIANVSRRLEMQRFKTKSIKTAGPGQIAVSRLGTLAAASVKTSSGEDIIVVSVYGVWESSGEIAGGGWICADASVHRLISDLSALIGSQVGHKIIVAGDLNILYGYGDNGSPYWGARYQTVFDRMETLGLKFIGPQAPNGRRAEPWPEELPETSRNVPTYYHNRQVPETATRQLDFVFASTAISDRISVTALNDPESWGPSDHCCLEIEIN